jgi:hypothetical protein
MLQVVFLVSLEKLYEGELGSVAFGLAMQKFFNDFFIEKKITL